MDKQKLIYSVLNSVYKNEENINIPKEDVVNSLKFLESEKLISLKSTKIYIHQDKDDLYTIENSNITLDGIEYLNKNNKLSKAYEFVKKVKDLL